MTEFANWQENERHDGVRAVHDSITDRWIVCTPSGETIAACPCCSRPLLSNRAAQLVADAELPMQPDQNRATSTLHYKFNQSKACYVVRSSMLDQADRTSWRRHRHALQPSR